MLTVFCKDKDAVTLESDLVAETHPNTTRLSFGPRLRQTCWLLKIDSVVSNGELARPSSSAVARRAESRSTHPLTTSRVGWAVSGRLPCKEKRLPAGACRVPTSFDRANELDERVRQSDRECTTCRVICFRQKLSRERVLRCSVPANRVNVCLRGRESSFGRLSRVGTLDQLFSRRCGSNRHTQNPTRCHRPLQAA